LIDHSVNGDNHHISNLAPFDDNYILYWMRFLLTKQVAVISQKLGFTKQKWL